MEKLLQKFLQALAFVFGEKTKPIEAPERVDPVDSEDPFILFNTYQLKDGHLLISELEKYQVPFQVEFNDGIKGGALDHREINAGAHATISIYIEEQNWEILSDLVKLHFHYP